MSIVWVGSESAINEPDFSDQTTYTVDVPSGTQDGDFMIAVMHGFQTTGVTKPSGWTQKRQHTSGSNIEGNIMVRVASSEPASYTWTWPGIGGSCGVSIHTFRGAYDCVTEEADTGSGVSGVFATPSEPSVTGPGRGLHCVIYHAAGGAGTTMSTEDNATELVDIGNTDGSPSNHYRGQAVYIANDFESTDDPSPGIDIIHWIGGAPDESVTFQVYMLSIPQANLNGGDLSGFTSSFTGSYVPIAGASLNSTLPSFGMDSTGVVVPEGSIASTMPSFQSAFTARPSGVRIEIKVDGVWTDITQYVRYDSSVAISRGASSANGNLQPSRAQMTLDNRDFRFSPRNPEGPYYGSIGRNTEIRVSKQEFGYRFWGEIASWQFNSDKTGTDSTVDIDCAGLVRRLSQGVPPLKSALYREITQNTEDLPLHYWPCEDLEGSPWFSPAIGSYRMFWSREEPELANYDEFKCSAPIPDISGGIWRTYPLRDMDVSDGGINVSFLMSAPEGIVPDATIIEIESESVTPGIFYNWALLYTATDTVTAFMPVLTGGAPDTGTFPIGGNLIHVQVLVEADYSGATNDVPISVYMQNITDTTPTLVANTTAGNGASSLKNPNLRFGREFGWTGTPNRLSDVYIGHVAVYPGATLRTFNSLSAHLNEPAGDRVKRLVEEEGITFDGTGTMSDSQEMGSELQKTFVDLLKECKATDLGALTETRDSLGIGYRPIRDIYNQTETVELDYSAFELSGTLSPLEDDKDTLNRIIVNRTDGGEGVAEKTSGVLSTSAPPDGVGKYESSVTLSLGGPDQIGPQAGWRVHLGTVDEPRMPRLTIALENPRFADNFTFQQEATNVDIGDVIKITNPPEWLPPEDIYQIVDGYSEKFDQYTHKITYNTSPFSPYYVAVAGGASARVTSSSMSLNEDLTTTETAIDVTTAELWATDTTDFDIMVGGERMTVTGISGASSPQTFTVTRSVNGIVKTHESGAKIEMFQPAIVAL